LPLESGDCNVKAMTGASNKPFDYLACGLALLVSQLPDWEEMFVRPGYAISCDPTSAESLATAMGWLYEHPEEVRAMGERGRRRILKDWNYDHQFQPVLNMLSAPRTRESFAPDPAPQSRTVR
jgi:spore maturation protein CgeB